MLFFHDVNTVAWVEGNTPNMVDLTGAILELPNRWNLCAPQLQTERNCSCWNDTDANVPIPYAGQVLYVTARQACEMGGFIYYPECDTSVSPVKILLFGGSRGGTGEEATLREGPRPECQTPTWYGSADQVVPYPGYNPTTGEGTVPENNPVPVGGKQGQANLAGRPQPGTIVIGYSAGADTALIYAYDHRDTGFLRGIVALNGTLSGQMTDGRSLQGQTSDGRYVWETVLDEILLSGIDVFYLDDKSGGTSLVSDYVVPEEARGQLYYTGDEYLLTEHLDGVLNGRFGIGTNNSPEICEAVLNWFGVDTSGCRANIDPNCTNWADLSSYFNTD